MKAFLQRFALLISGVPHGFDRLVFKGKLRQLYGPDGMHTLLALNRVRRGEFKAYAAPATTKVLQASPVSQAKQLRRFRYLNSGTVSKEDTAREIAARHHVQEGPVCVLQCVEPCRTFDRVKNDEGFWEVRGERGKCPHLYHYYIHPRFGRMYVPLQTRFPFEIQVGIDGREWLARQMDRENLKCERGDDKFLRVEDWRRARQLPDEQLQTDRVRELGAPQKQVHPLHPRLPGPMRVPYDRTVFQSGWAADVAFHSEEVPRPYFDRRLRQAFLSYDAIDVLRFLGRSQRVAKSGPPHVETSLYDRFDGKRIKHRLYENSLKLYSHYNVLRSEMTIDNAAKVPVFRRSENDPKWPPMWRYLRRNGADLPRRAEVGQKTTERYLGAPVGLAETRTVTELAEPLTRRAPEPRGKSAQCARRMRGLNPLAAEDAALPAAIGDPKWMIRGLRNRDLVAALYKDEARDAAERRRRSAHVTHLLRLLRAHALLEKTPQTHRYQLSAEARIEVQALPAVRHANPDELTKKAA